MATVILWDGYSHWDGYSYKSKSNRFYRRMSPSRSNPYQGEERIIAKGNIFEGIEAKW